MNKKKFFVRAASCAYWLALCAPSFAQPAVWQPTLLEPEGQIRGPSDAIRLLLPALPVAILQNIALELDEVDVTGLVSTADGRHAVFTPPQPLAFGEHSLRLIEYAVDGDIIERGAWTLDVRKTAAFRDASLESNVTVNGVTRVADESLLQPEPSRNHANGAAQIQGAVAGDGWRTGAYIDLLSNSRRDLMPRQDEKIDMGQFLLMGEAGPVIAQAGDHTVGPESLVMQSFNRRGVSAGLRSQESSASLVAFSMRTQDIVGFQQGFGVSDDANRTDGVVVTTRPLAADRDALVLWATHVSGEGPDQAGDAGSGIVGDPTITKGDASSLAADSQLFNRHVRLRGEISRTRFDFDGAGRDTDLDGVVDSDLPEESSRAHTALIAYTPWHDKQVSGKPLALNLGVENRRIGTYFRSPANPAGIADRDVLRAFTNLNWSGIDVQLSSARETDNVEDQPLLPQTETRQNFVATTYTPQIDLAPLDAGQAPSLPWFGQPSFSATWLDMDQDVTRAAAGLVAGALRAANSTTLGAAFNYRNWNWAINHSIVDTDEFSGFSPDTHASTTQLNAGVRIGAKLTLTPSFQRSDVEERDVPAGFTERDTETTTAGLSVGYFFTENLAAAVNYSRNRQKITDDSENWVTNDVTGNINWTAVRPVGMRPGLTLALEGSYQDQADRLDPIADRDTYQVFMKAAIGWSPRF